MIRLFVLFIMLQATILNAAPTFETLAKLTDSPATLKGDFKQKKILKAFDTSITSTGQFSYQRNAFIRWKTVAPVENELLMTPDGISSQQGGNELVNLTADKTPAIKMLSSIFFAVLTAEWQTLAEYFDVVLEGDQSSWKVLLTPKDETLKQAVTNVNLAGDRLVKEVILHEQSGDSTHIVFSNLSQ